MILDPELQSVIDTEWNSYYKHNPITAYDKIELVDIWLLLDCGCYSKVGWLDPDSLYWLTREWHGWGIIQCYGMNLWEHLFNILRYEIQAEEDARVFALLDALPTSNYIQKVKHKSPKKIISLKKKKR